MFSRKKESEDLQIINIVNQLRAESILKDIDIILIL